MGRGAVCTPADGKASGGSGVAAGQSDGKPSVGSRAAAGRSDGKADARQESIIDGDLSLLDPSDIDELELTLPCEDKK
jgi:hypothetical protein